MSVSYFEFAELKSRVEQMEERLSLLHNALNVFVKHTEAVLVHDCFDCLLYTPMGVK